MNTQQVEYLLLDAFASGAASGAHITAVILDRPDEDIPVVLDRVERSLRESSGAVREIIWEMMVGIDSDAGQGRPIPIAD